MRTIRYYVTQGLLPGPLGAGPRSAYTYEHLARLGAIRVLKARYLPLAEIGRRLAGMSAGDVEALAAAPAQDELVEAVGRPLGATGSALAQPAGERSVAARADRGGRLGLPSARPELRRGTASSAPVPEVGSNLWRRVLLAPGVELSFQLSGDAARDAAIAELVEQATRRLTALGAAQEEER